MCGPFFGRSSSRSATVEQIRVILAGVPAMLREVVGAMLRDQPDMAIVAETESATHLPSLSRRTRADVIIMAADANGIPAAGRRAVNKQPHLKLIAIDSEGRGWLYELRPHEQHIPDVTPTELAVTIRSAALAGAVPMEITGESSIARHL